MSAIGADVEQLRLLARKLNEAGTRIDEGIVNPLNALMMRTPWRGNDADEFYHYWRSTGMRLLRISSQQLKLASETVRKNADEQETTSSSDGDNWSSTGVGGSAGVGLNAGGHQGLPQAPPAPASGVSPEDGTAYDGGFTVGEPPERHIHRDNDFPWGSKKGEDTFGDHLSWAKWGAQQHGAELLRPDLDDALPLYEHYRGNTGTPMEIDYEEAYKEDANIRSAVDTELNSALTAANQMVAEGYTDVHFSGEMRNFPFQPATENWQKAIGAHNYWSDSHLRVEGDTVHLTVTVSEGDLWNFNRGMTDVASGASDNDNGRFQELGWAREFETHGELTREYTWKVGEEPPFQDLGSGSQSSDDERIYSGRSNGGWREDRAEPTGDSKVNWNLRGK